MARRDHARVSQSGVNDPQQFDLGNWNGWHKVSLVTGKVMTKNSKPQKPSTREIPKHQIPNPHDGCAPTEGATWVLELRVSLELGACDLELQPNPAANFARFKTV